MERKWLDNYERQENYIINNQNNDIIPIAQGGRNLKRVLNENIKTDSNSIINYTKLKNINPGREIKKQTQKIENVQKKNNVSRKKALEIIQKEEFDKNISGNPQSVGEIAPVEDQSIASKTWEVLTNPATAASYWLNDQRIPDRFSKGERNNLDIATDLFNPFGIAESAKNAVKETINLPKNLYEGNYSESGNNLLNAGLNTLSVIPALKELKGVKVPKINTSINSSNVNKAGLPNPLKLIDNVIPRPFAPGQVIGIEDSWNYYSPLNFIPGYGKKLVDNSSGMGNFVGFRKFGNSIDDVIESKTLRPRNNSFEMGSEQIRKEGNWAESGKVNENYPGVFEATMNPNIEGSNIKLEKWKNRNGIVGTTKEGNVEIPLEDPGLSFNRRLPFSSRYVPINKEKLLNNEFQLATQLPYAQSLLEKYGIWTGLGVGGGYLYGGKEQAEENFKTINKYTIDPIVELSKKGLINLNDIPKKREGGVIKDNNGYWNPDNWGKAVEIDSNDITMKGVNQPLLGISDEGDIQYMEPNKDYKFKGKKVREFPIARNGVNNLDENSLQQLDQLTNFTNYNKLSNGGWLDKF